MITARELVLQWYCGDESFVDDFEVAEMEEFRQRIIREVMWRLDDLGFPLASAFLSEEFGVKL